MPNSPLSPPMTHKTSILPLFKMNFGRTAVFHQENEHQLGNYVFLHGGRKFKTLMIEEWRESVGLKIYCHQGQVGRRSNAHRQTKYCCSAI